MLILFPLFSQFIFLAMNDTKKICIIQLVHGLVDRIMEVMGVPFLPNGDKTGYHINRSEVSFFSASYILSFITKRKHSKLFFCSNL